jgi:hypothetical protein
MLRSRMLEQRVECGESQGVVLGGVELFGGDKNVFATMHVCAEGGGAVLAPSLDELASFDLVGVFKTALSRASFRLGFDRVTALVS